MRETGERAIVNWGYNAWGGKYPPFDLDDNIPGKVAADMIVVMVEPDAIVALGAIVADELYGWPLPVVLVNEAELAKLRTGDQVRIEHDGSVRTINAAL